MPIIVTYRRKESTEVVGSFEDKKAAVEGAVVFLKTFVREDDLGGCSWEEAVEQWEDMTDGYEDFSFEER